MSLRNMLIGIGIVITITPYLGLPSRIDSIVYTALGFTIVFSLTILKKLGTSNETNGESAELPSYSRGEPRTLEVKRKGGDIHQEILVEKNASVEKKL